MEFAAQNVICLKAYEKQSKLHLAKRHTQMSDTLLHHTCGYPVGDAVGSSHVSPELRESSWTA